MRVRRRWPAAAMVSDDGRLLMVLCEGEAAIDGQSVLGGGAMAGLLSLDGRDLRRSAAVLLLPFEQGRLRLPAASGDVELGEWRDGRWHPLEDIAGQGQGIMIDIDADRATAAALICTKESRPRWRERLETLCQRPWELRGY